MAPWGITAKMDREPLRMATGTQEMCWLVHVWTVGPLKEARKDLGMGADRPESWWPGWE